MAELKYIVVHHSASDSQATVEQIRASHIARGFRDIGYHHIIRHGEGDAIPVPHAGRRYDTDDDWEPWEYGAHAKGHNHHAIGVCLVGNYHEEPLPAPMLSMLCWTLAALCRHWGLGVSAIVGHRELASTACPGRFVDMDLVRRTVAKKLAELE